MAQLKTRVFGSKHPHEIKCKNNHTEFHRRPDGNIHRESKRLCHYTSVRNFDKSWPFFKILSLLYSPRNLQRNSCHTAQMCRVESGTVFFFDSLCTEHLETVTFASTFGFRLSEIEHSQPAAEASPEACVFCKPLDSRFSSAAGQKTSGQ